MRRPILTDIVRNLPALVPFVGPEAQERARGRPFRARLGANESLFGPSPEAIRAMAAAAAENWKYSDPESHELRHALARFHGVDADNIVIGEGIDGLLGLTVQMAVDPGSAVVTSDGAYPTFNFHVAGQGGRLVKVPFRDDREDLGALLDAAARERARIIYVSNPDNPMGTWWSAAEIGRLIERLPERRAPLPRRGLLRYGAPRRHPAVGRRQPAGAALQNLFEGLRSGRRAHRLLRGRARTDRDLREGAKPLRYQPRRSGGCAGRARRSGLSQ